MNNPPPGLRTYEEGVRAREASPSMPQACGQTSEWWRGWYDHTCALAGAGESKVSEALNKIRTLLSDKLADRGHGCLYSAEELHPEVFRALDDSAADRARLLALLAHAVSMADGWHDDSRGGPITDDPLMDEARALVKAAQQSDPPAPGNTDR